MAGDLFERNMDTIGPVRGEDLAGNIDPLVIGMRRDKFWKKR